MRTALDIAAQTAVWGLKFGGRCIMHGLNFVGAIPPYIDSVIDTPATQQVVGGCGYTLVTDVIPLLASNTIYQWLNDNAFNESNGYHDLWYMGALAGITYVASAVFHFRQQTSLVIRSTVATLQHQKAFQLPSHQSRPQDPNPCAQARCTPMRFVKGEIRANLGYFALLFAIGAAKKTPYIGDFLGVVLFAQLTGELFLEYRLSHLCDTHRNLFFRQNPELSLTLGLLVAGFTWLLSDCLESKLGTAQQDSQFAIRTLVTFLFMGISFHMPIRKPKMDAADNKRWPTPIGIFRAITDGVVNVSTAGVKQAAKTCLRKQAKNPLDPGVVIDKATAIFELEILGCKPIKFIYKVVTPSMLHSEKQFINDHVMRPHIEALRQKTVQYISDLQADSKTLTVKLVTKAPSWAGKRLVSLSKGWPPILSEIVIKCLRSKKFMEKLDAFKTHLIDLGPEVGSFELVNAERIPGATTGSARRIMLRPAPAPPATLDAGDDDTVMVARPPQATHHEDHDGVLVARPRQSVPSQRVRLRASLTAQANTRTLHEDDDGVLIPSVDPLTALRRQSAAAAPSRQTVLASATVDSGDDSDDERHNPFGPAGR